jgi:hypothetical protein
MRLLLSACFVLLGLAPLHAALPAGQWIWRAGTASTANEYVYFRRAVTLSAPPSASSLQITADTRYVLYVNGTLVGRGPARSPTRYMAYDSWDIAPYLTTGKNVIAALVHHTGEWTFRSQTGRAGFLCAASITVGGQTNTIGSDAAWKALSSAAWDRSQARMNIALDFAEVYDARKAPNGWKTATFDDSQWPAAAVLGPAGMAPWTDLSASDIPPNQETPLRPASVVDAMSVQSIPDAAEIPFGRLNDGLGWAVNYAATSIYAPKEMSAILQIGGDDGYKVWLNGALITASDAVHDGRPAERSVAVTLSSGWNRLLVKSVKMTGAWSFFFSVPNTPGVVISSEKDAARPDTWRVSPAFPFDGSKGLALGLNSVFVPEPGADTAAWREITAGVRPWQTVAGVMRFEARAYPTIPGVQNAAALTSGGTAVFQPGSAVVLDMGREVLGYPRFTVTGAVGGEILDVGYSVTL